MLLGLALQEEGRNDCRGKHLSVRLMGSLGEKGLEGPWQCESSLHRGGEAPRFPRPPKEKREHWGEIYAGVYPHEGFPTQRYKWGQDMKDARSQLSVHPRGALPAPAQRLRRISPFHLALLGSATAEGKAAIVRASSVLFRTEGRLPQSVV